MNSSIFRKEKISPKIYDFNKLTNSLKKQYRTHDNGTPRAREYFLNSIILFTDYKGISMKAFIETDFDYFLWLPKNIHNLTYDKAVLLYARKCLNFLEELPFHMNKKFSKLGYTIEQISIMLEYENLLDTGEEESLINSYKSMVNVDFYKEIYNKPKERLIRQYLTKMNYSPEFRRKYFNEISTKL